jgi:hypothetical protein
MIETQLAQLAALVPSMKTRRIRGNLCLLVRMFVQYPPDGVSHLDGHELLTMLGDPYSRFLIFNNYAQERPWLSRYHLNNILSEN